MRPEKKRILISHLLKIFKGFNKEKRPINEIINPANIASDLERATASIPKTGIKDMAQTIKTAGKINAIR